VKSVSDLLADRAQAIRDRLDELLAHAALNYWHSPNVIGFNGDHSWAKLEPEGRRAQSRALAEYETYIQLVRVLLRGQPQDALRVLEETEKTLEPIIQQSGLTWCKTVDQARAKAHAALDKQLSRVGDLYDPSEGKHVSYRTPTPSTTTPISTAGVSAAPRPSSFSCSPTCSRSSTKRR
jgi:hypothetical protein